MRTCFLLMLAGLVSPFAAFAQEFRVYTSVTDQAAERKDRNGNAPIVSRSLTIFHAGRVYDYVRAANEVIIFEPSQDRFIVLNLEQNVTTEATRSEINRLMKIALNAAAQKKSPMIAFQLNPRFEKSFDANTDRVTLSSPFIRYEAKLANVKEESAVTAYRRYTDAVARLNYVMHPRILLPGPRRALNEELATRQALPTEVELLINIKPKIHLKAEHSIRWSLGENDRSRIQQWNAKLKDRNTRRVTLREYQRLNRQ